MNYLLFESLKIYKLQYLYSILTVLIGVSFIIYFEFGILIRTSALALIFTPELIRLTKLQNDGYLKLVMKLPINADDLYTHKFVVRSSGTILVVLLLIIINYFYALSHGFLEFLNIFVSNLFVWITFNFNDKSSRMSFQKFAIYAISLFIFFSIFSLILTFDIDGNKSANYLLILITQTITAYYLGKVYNFLSHKFSKNYSNKFRHVQ